ncbi:MAG: hypothetical protein IPP71_07825 [Bacteroidetes bacterium]|nr:hypothetical protein [Bacteroidota bacterium]
MERSFQQKREWLCGSKGQILSYSFMNGIAGIGNYYLRIANPRLISSGLMMDELNQL